MDDDIPTCEERNLCSVRKELGLSTLRLAVGIIKQNLCLCKNDLAECRMMDVKTVFYLSRWEETSLVVTGAKGCVLSFLIFVSLCFPSFCLFSLSFSLSLSKQIQLISERFLLRFDS